MILTYSVWVLMFAAPGERALIAILELFAMAELACEVFLIWLVDRQRNRVKRQRQPVVT